MVSARSNTPEKNVAYLREGNKYQSRIPLTCYNCQQIGHVSNFRPDKKVFTKPSNSQTQPQQKPNNTPKQYKNVKQTRFDDEEKTRRVLTISMYELMRW